jgi:hypothetical protein
LELNVEIPFRLVRFARSSNSAEVGQTFLPNRLVGCQDDVLDPIHGEITVFVAFEVYSLSLGSILHPLYDIETNRLVVG